jgi:hypothetical protein
VHSWCSRWWRPELPAWFRPPPWWRIRFFGAILSSISGLTCWTNRQTIDGQRQTIDGQQGIRRLKDLQESQIVGRWRTQKGSWTTKGGNKQPIWIRFEAGT